MPFPRIVKAAPVRRDEILDAAQRLFAGNGYDATSVSQIIEAVGVSKGAFYHHFESKEDLIEALACRYARESAALADEVLADPTLDAFSKLVAFLGTMRRHKAETAAELRATFEPMFRPENLQLFERTQRAVADVVRPILTRIIVEGVAERTFDTPDPENAAETIMHLLTAHRELSAQLLMARDRLAFERISRVLLDKMTYLGTVIDRILGLPEGSIELADRSVLDALACGLDVPSSAA
ncbi:TetR/AcrR family transcriptional regulator [Devosia sp. ZB163]|uniref:TetR/AcrR family transcriptional regulator n=1 Tax=Devosia sp. ZB163 TaxID=3025938 RepID=UPI00235E5C46|nr:TetR/AcrR family transcriptional regulator [Devosia sp. ZB163]MDC9825036.1 TetR/AcrR family transcriptional regulator [Devosia sp. ZB163]